MALNAATCAQAIVTQLKTINPKINAEQESKMINEWTNILNPLFTHISTQGVVSTATTGTTIVASGSSAGTWPSTGTGTGTLS